MEPEPLEMRPERKEEDDHDTRHRVVDTPLPCGVVAQLRDARTITVRSAFSGKQLVGPVRCPKYAAEVINEIQKQLPKPMIPEELGRNFHARVRRLDQYSSQFAFLPPRPKVRLMFGNQFLHDGQPLGKRGGEADLVLQCYVLPLTAKDWTRELEEQEQLARYRHRVLIGYSWQEEDLLPTPRAQD